jgi:hypothetical protein
MIGRFVIAAALLLVCAAAAPALADTAAKATAHTANVELVRTSKGASKTVAFAVALVDDGAPSKVTARLADAAYTLELQRESGARGKGARAGLVLELSRNSRSGPDAFSIRATSTAPLGQRAVLLAVDAGDGVTLEVAVTLH